MLSYRNICAERFKMNTTHYTIYTMTQPSPPPGWGYVMCIALLVLYEGHGYFLTV